MARGKSLAAFRAEARKCVLVCANCHGEIEAGLDRLAARRGPFGWGRSPRRGRGGARALRRRERFESSSRSRSIDFWSWSIVASSTRATFVALFSHALISRWERPSMRRSSETRRWRSARRFVRRSKLEGPEGTGSSSSSSPALAAGRPGSGWRR